MSNDVDRRLQLLRRLHGWSQRQLAKRAGVPHSAISMIEHGQVSPSINSLRRVLDAVPISLADFFSLDLDAPGQISYKRDVIPTAEAANGVVCASLGVGDGVTPTVLRWLLPAGSDVGPGLDRRSEAAGFVVRGELELIVGPERDRLQAGDAFHFHCRRPHYLHNPGVADAEVVAALLRPQ